MSEEKDIVCYKGGEGQNISIETLQSEIALLLQTDNLSFLMGAGCSSNIVDERETGIPGMKVLYEKFFSENPDFSATGEKLNGLFDNSLEKLLEVLNAIDTVNQIKMIDADIAVKMKMIRNFLRSQLVAGFESKEVHAIYKNFYAKITQKTRKDPINVFTTNYDLFNEMALDELGFPYNNGFSGSYRRKFNPTSYNYMYVENMNLHRDVWERVSSFFNLIKIHGSINWVSEDDQIIEKDYTLIDEDETLMIYPTPLKEKTTLLTPYTDLFRYMENKIIQKNSVLIVLGYSFGDEHINRIILNGLSVPSFRLVVFGNSKEIKKLIALNDARITIVYSEDKIHYFKNFVEKILPEMHPDIEEKLKMKSVSNIISSYETEVMDE